MAFTNNPRRAEGDGVAEVCSLYKEGNSQSFKKGEIVTISSGTIIAGADSDLSAGLVFGIALKDATNVISGNITIPVEVINPHDLYLIRVSNAGTAALCTTATLGTKYGIDVASNVWTLDTNAADENVVTAVKYHYDAAGSADYWIYARFISSACQAYEGA